MESYVLSSYESSVYIKERRSASKLYINKRSTIVEELLISFLSITVITFYTLVHYNNTAAMSIIRTSYKKKK
jgi:hypothetical protein